MQIKFSYSYMYKRIQKSKRCVNKLLKRKSIKKQIKKRKSRKKQSKRRESIRKKQLKRTLKFRKNKKQYGGDFNSEETEELKAILRDKYTFTEDEMSQIIKKLNLSAQQFAGPYFDQLKDHLIHGEFRDKQHLIDWINYAHGELEERVETDPEYTTEDDFVDEFDNGDDDSDDDRNN